MLSSQKVYAEYKKSLKSNDFEGHFLLCSYKMIYFRFAPIGSKLVSIEAVCYEHYDKKLSAQKFDFYYVIRVFERFWGQRSNQKIALKT